jgi:DNA-binding CsgD family transcriptional regulator
LEFFHDVDRNRNINNIETALFSPYSTDNYFPNLLKQKFWFRVHLKNADTTSQDLLFKIRAYSFLKEVSIYQIDTSGTKKIFHINDYLNRKIETKFTLVEEATYYFEVDFAWTVLFRLQIITPENNQNKILKETILQGVYYGFSFLILCLNVLFYFFTKKRFFIYYVIFQLGIIASIAFLDNHIYFLTDNGSFNKAFSYLYNYTISFGSILFISNALHLKKRFPAFNYICHPILIISFLITSYCFLTDTPNTTTVPVNLLILLIGFITAIYYSKKLIYARFIVAGYSVLFICHILYSLPVLVGYKDLGFYEWHYKVGSIIEMLIFMAAIPYRYKVLFTEKTTLEEKISKQEANFKKKIETLKNANISVEEQLIKFKKVYDLKKREVEILEIMNTGATNREIADKLYISLDTVKHYCSKLYEKTSAKNRTKLITLFNERDFSETDSNNLLIIEKKRKNV